MGTPNKQIGWSQEASLLQIISRQLDQLAGLLAASGGGGGATSSGSITTSSSISSSTTDSSGGTQSGKTIIIYNGASAINYTCDGPDGFVTTIVKEGTAAITFVAGAGRTIVGMDGTLVLNGAPGSRATIVSVGTLDRVYITNY